MFSLLLLLLMNIQFSANSTIMLLAALHYASICSYASTLLLCSKLCQHNSPRPTCVADVLPTCTVAGSPDQKQKYNFEWRYLLLSLRRYCYYIMISVHRLLIIVDSHFHFTQHSCFHSGLPNFGLYSHHNLPLNTLHTPYILMSSCLLAVTTVSSACM